MSHTPLPWCVYCTEEELVIRGTPEQDHDVCELHPLDEGNAEFICRAVNFHDKLLAALHATVKWMDFVQKKLGDTEDLDRNIRKYGARKWIKQFGEGAGHRANEARAAIAQAEGQP